MNKLSAFRYFALPLLLIVGFLGGFVPGTILAASIPAVQQHDTSQASIPAAVTFAHDTSQASIPAVTAPACAETGLTGPALQENQVFCNPAPVIYGTCPASSVADGGIVYSAAIGAANRHIILGTVESCAPDTDWSGLPINRVVLDNGAYRVEFHGDNVVRIYNNVTNQQVYP